MPSIQNVILVGGGGNLGPSVLKALDAGPTFVVSVLARQSSTSSYPSHVTVHRVDDSYPEDEVSKAFKGQDAVVCALNLANIAQQLRFIDIAVRTGVKWFIPAEFGGNKEGARNGEPIPLHGTKELVHEHLIKNEQKGLSWTAIATGPFIDWGIANGFLGFDINTSQAKIYGTGNERWTGTKVSTIGLAIARLLRKPEEVKNKFIYIYSVSTTQNEILAALESASDTKWDVSHVNMADEVMAGRETLAQGNRAGVVPLILSYFFQEGMGADYERDVVAANNILELPTESVTAIVRDVLQGKVI